jgi:hypothetical protein
MGRGVAHDSGKCLEERPVYCDGNQTAIRALPGSAIRENVNFESNEVTFNVYPPPEYPADEKGE